MRAQYVGLFLAAAFTFMCAEAEGQEVIRIDHRRDCSACRVEVVSVATIPRYGFNGSTTNLAAVPTGGFWIFDPDERAIQRYDANGRLLRVVGRAGGGPGEYEMVRNLHVDPDGSLLVFDQALRRLSKFDSSGKFLSSQVFLGADAGGEMPLLRLRNGDFLVNTLISGQGDASFVLTTFANDGRVTGRYDPSSGGPRAEMAQRRLLWMRRNGEILVGDPYRFSIGVYSPTMDRKRSQIELRPSWPTTPLTGEPSTGAWDLPYTPRLWGIWEDSQDHLWVLSSGPSTLWRPGRPFNPKERHPRALLDSVYARPRVESVLEVIDMKTRRVIAKATTEGSFGQAFGGRFLLSKVEDSDGDVRTEIKQVQVRR